MVTRNDIQAIKDRVKQVSGTCTTVESIKTGLVLPFLQRVGWDVFSPTEVIPQYSGVGQSEPIDFAIKKDGVLLYVIKCITGKLPDLKKNEGIVLKYLRGEGIKVGVVTNGVQYLLCNVECKNVNLLIDLNKAEETMDLINMLGNNDGGLNDIDGYFRDNAHRMYVQQFKEKMLKCPDDEMMSILYATFTTSMPEVRINKQRFKQLWSSGGAVLDGVLDEEEKAAEVKGVLEKVIEPKGTAKKVAEKKAEPEKRVSAENKATVENKVVKSTVVEDSAKTVSVVELVEEKKVAQPKGTKKREADKGAKGTEKGEPIVIDNTAWRTEVVTNVAIPQTLECDLVMEQFSGNVTYYTKEGKFVLHKGAVLRKIDADENRKLYPITKYAPDYVLNKDVIFRSATDVVAYISGKRVQGYSWLRVKNMELSLDAYLRNKAVELGYLNS